MARSCLGHRPNRIFEIARRTDLARNKHVDREMEGKAELITHNHSASWKSQNQRRRIVAVLTQLIGQHPAGFFAIAEDTSSPPWIKQASGNYFDPREVRASIPCDTTGEHSSRIVK